MGAVPKTVGTGDVECGGDVDAVVGQRRAVEAGDLIESVRTRDTHAIRYDAQARHSHVIPEQHLKELRGIQDVGDVSRL